MIPDFLEKLLEKQYGKDLTKKIIEGYSKKRKVSLRINTIKTNTEHVKEVLSNAGIEFETVMWSKNALVIKSACENDIEELEIYKNGEIYMQSLSSMLPPIVLDPKEKEDILDMAAAPGGKTTEVAAITMNKAHITACEMNKIRAQKLKYNIEKQGATSVYLMETDSRRLNDYFSFDKILLDSPCSGSGTIYLEDKNIEKYFTLKLIEKSTKTQLELLKKAIKILKPGKEMVYSTCSILSPENEDIIKSILKDRKCEIVPIIFSGIEEIPILPTSIDGTLCIMPNEFYEGFFIAKIRKK